MEEAAKLNPVKIQTSYFPLVKGAYLQIRTSSCRCTINSSLIVFTDMEALEEAPWGNLIQGSQDLSTGRCMEVTLEHLTLIREVTVLLEEAI